MDPNRQLGSLGFAGRREVVTRRRPGVRPALQAMDDDEGHTINDELRMIGLEGDYEDGMEEEREELFGRRGNVEVIMPPPPPIGVGVGGAGAGADAGVGAGAGAGADTGAGGAGGAADGAAPDSVSHAGEKRGRPCTSKVWDEYEKLFKQINGKTVRYGAKCLHCKSILSGFSSSGTGHLSRHLLTCRSKKKKSGAQSILSFDADGSVVSWEYSPDVARTQLCRLIAKLDLPLGFGETNEFKEYIQIAHNPRFTPVSRQTTTRDIAKYFSERRDDLVKYLSSNSVSSVGLTSDIWSGNAKEDYLSVICHYVNSDWQLEKRVLGLSLIDVSHSGDNIAERVHTVISDFGLTNKVFSITLDNASANASAMEALTPLIRGYIGDEYLHQRCACHIINLIVKSGLKRLKPYLEAFRTAISFVNSSNQRIAAYKSYCIAVGVRPRKFQLDMDVRWNSTYLMLKHLVPHKQTFGVFIQTQYPRAEGTPYLLTDGHWYVAEKILEFLELFYDSTVVLSGVYYPTAPLILHNLIEIAGQLKNYENDRMLREVVIPMKSKYLKYWNDIPLLYSIAFIMDPRAKIKGFSNALRLLSSLTGTDYSAYFTSVRAALSDMFGKYESKFGSIRLARPTHKPSTGKKKAQWGKIFGDGSTSTTSPGSGLGSVGAGGSFIVPLGRRTSASALLQAASTGGTYGISSELTAYLDSDTVSQFDDDFNILTWWHEHKQSYPVLSILAKDVLTVPVSTISSESTFSLTGRIIEERRRQLKPEMVEMLTCIKDWEAADERAQHMVEDGDLEAAYEDQYLDETPAQAAV